MDNSDVEVLDDLLRQAREGDSSALGVLLHRHRPWLVTLARRWYPQALRLKEDISDVVQNCYREAIESFAKFRGDNIYVFRIWLQGILRNVRLSAMRYWGRQLRNNRREQPLTTKEGGEVPLVVAQTSILDKMARQEDIDLVKRAIGNLTPEDCSLVEMRFLDRMSYDEISGRLQTNAPRLRKRIHRTLKRIRKALPVG